jgi:hypothetical protein
VDADLLTREGLALRTGRAVTCNNKTQAVVMVAKDLKSI